LLHRISNDPLASPLPFGDNRRVTDHFAALLAVALVIAFVLGTLGAQFMRAVRTMYTAQNAVRAATAGMRAARLRFVFLAVIIFAIAWPYIHGA
jgi:hypothetical protein